MNFGKNLSEILDKNFAKKNGEEYLLHPL